jgi:hypothetical protein
VDIHRISMINWEANQQKLLTILYSGNTGCLHSKSYFVTNEYREAFCGPCFFREGFWDEMPTRMSIKEDSGLFGSPQLDPRTLAHIMASSGLILPEPGENLKHFRHRREKLSKPTPKLFPFISALWKLVGYQPPLARVLIPFVQGQNEALIAYNLDESIYNVQERLSKGVRVAQKFLVI